MGPRPFGRGRLRASPRLPSPRPASMGPRPFGRGRYLTVLALHGAAMSFNGAATFRSRKEMDPDQPHKPEHQLQWGRDLSVAEGRTSRAPRPRHGRFNGAATFRSRKASTLRAGVKSMAPLQWGRDLSVAEGLAVIETSMRASALQWGPRPFGRGRPSVMGRILLVQFALQWGRDLSVAEGTACTAGSFGRGLLQWGRDLSVAEGDRARGGPPAGARFNGAATFRSRKDAEWEDLPDAEAASMGPRPFGRGRGYTNMFSFFTLPLQWGRDLSVAEGAGPRGPAASRGRFNGAATFRSRKDGAPYWDVDAVVHASMGPRPFGRGRPAHARSCKVQAYASMGPRPFGRGRPPALAA